MRSVHIFGAVLVGLLFVGFCVAADDAPPLMVAKGVVDKVEKDSLTIRPRAADGKFEKNLTLKLTGTSQISILSTQKRAGKAVFVQRDTKVTALEPKQHIAVIYANGPSGTVLLAAVAQHESEK